MRPGTLRHRVQIVQSSVTTPDGLGGGTRTQSTVATVWARVEPLSAREASIGGGLREQITHRVTMRYPDSFTLTADMRLVWNGRTLYIKGITQPFAITQKLVVYCLEGE